MTSGRRLRVAYIAGRAKHRGLRREILSVNAVRCLYLWRLAHQQERRDRQDHRDSGNHHEAVFLHGGSVSDFYLWKKVPALASIPGEQVAFLGWPVNRLHKVGGVIVGLIEASLPESLSQ